MGLAVLSANDQRAIRKLLAAVAQNASVDPKQSLFTRQARGSRLRDFFAQEVTLKSSGADRIPESIHGRGELMDCINAARASLKEATFHFGRPQIEVTKDRTSAVVTVLLEGELNGERDAFRQRLSMALRRVEGRWLIAEIEARGGE